MLQRGALDNRNRAIAILHRGRRDDDGEDQAKNIHEQVPLAALELLPRIVSVPTSMGATLHTLAVDDRGCRFEERPGELRRSPLLGDWHGRGREGS